jgi:hypothetical protein
VARGELADEPRERAVAVVERELAEDRGALRAERIVDETVHAGDEAFAVGRVERAEQGAVAPDVARQSQAERGVGTLDVRADHARELAILLHQRAYALLEAAVLRIEVAAQRAAELVLEVVAVLLESLAQLEQHAVDLAAHRVGVDLAARGAQRQQPDAERGRRVLDALARIGDREELLDDLRIPQREHEIHRGRGRRGSRTGHGAPPLGPIHDRAGA